MQALERLAAVSQRSALSNTFNPTGKAVNQEDAKVKLSFFPLGVKMHFVGHG